MTRSIARDVAGVDVRPAGRAVAEGEASRPHGLPEVLAAAVAALAAAAVPSPQADAELLLAAVLGISRGELRLRAITGAELPLAALSRYAALVHRRAGREPLQHLTGTAAFRGLELAVGPGVFVPRPETESVVQHAIDALAAHPAQSPLAIDLGTGSGAIALAIATEVPRARVVAVERSHLAYTWARQNLRTVGVDNVRLVLADLAAAVPELDGLADVVISNPPYIPDAAVPRDPEVRLHDPAEALYGGVDGLDAVRAVTARALALLKPGGLLVLEHGEEQGGAVRALLEVAGFGDPRTYPDLAHRDRATLALR